MIDQDDLACRVAREESRYQAARSWALANQRRSA